MRGHEVCFKCEDRKIHPWHDDGTPNARDTKHFLGIDWFDDERKEKDRRKGKSKWLT